MEIAHTLTATKLRKVYEPPGGLRRAMMKSPIREPIVAVDGTDLAVRPGEVFGLLGPNGAGKTTLIKMLTTLLRPTSGRAEVGGFDVVDDEDEVRKRIGFVAANERAFYWRLTGRQNLEFFAALAGLPRRDISDRVVPALARFELTEHGDNMVFSYSSGQRQRLALARALVTDPLVLFLDEPTQNVDALGAAEIKNLIREIAADSTGRSVILATHRMDEAEQLCDRLVILDRGHVAFTGTVDELRSRVGGRVLCTIRIDGLTQSRVEELARGNRLKDLSVVRPSDNGCVDMGFSVDERGAPLSTVLEGLLGAGGTVVSCERRERRLEEMFVNLVDQGRAS